MELIPEGYVLLCGLTSLELGDVHCCGSEFVTKGSSVICSSHVPLVLSLCGAFCHGMKQEDGPQQMQAFQPPGQLRQINPFAL